MSRKSVEERFWSKVEKTEDGCWLWRGTQVRNGYGHFWLDGKGRIAHRVAYEWHVGPIPEGMEIDHRCRHTDCVNPAHLDVVSHVENVRRGRLGVLYTMPTHCQHGHVLTPGNARIWREPAGETSVVRWTCKQCDVAKIQRYRARLRHGLVERPEAPEYCVHGHRLTGDNLRIQSHGWVCVTCHRATGKRHYRKRARGRFPMPPPPAYCFHGHLLQGENLLAIARRWVCRTCKNEAQRRHRNRRKATQKE